MHLQLELPAIATLYALTASISTVTIFLPLDPICQFQVEIPTVHIDFTTQNLACLC